MLKRILTVFALILGVAGFASAEIKVDSLTWFDYEVNSYSNTGLNTGGAFYIGRQYVNLRGDIAKDWWGNSIYSRVTVDFAAPGTYVKQAYADWKFLDGAFVISGGLIPSHLAYAAVNDYKLPLKTASKLATVYSSSVVPSSADFGLGLSGKFLPIDGLTKNLFTYYFQALNGEGYKTLFSGSTASNFTYAYQGKLILTPITGVDLSVSYRNNPAEFTRSVYTVSNGTVTKALNYSTSIMSFYLQARDVVIPGMENPIPVDFLFEYYTYTDTKLDMKADPWSTTNVTGNTMQVSLGYGLLDSMITPYVRYDIITPSIDASATNLVDNILYVGANFRADPKGDLSIKPVYGMYLTDKGKTGTGKSFIKIEAEFKFGMTAWQ